MRALSVRQPWAGCIAYLGKSPENRTWRCPDRFIGTEVGIHAGQAVDETQAISVPVSGEEWASLFATRAEWDAWRFWRLGRKPRDVASWPPKLALGAVVAVATITGCHLHDMDKHCGEYGIEACAGVLCSQWAQLEQWHWQLGDQRPLAEPIPCKGALGLWTVPEDVESAVRAQIEVSRIG
jgi:hypothetical protein